MHRIYTINDHLQQLFPSGNNPFQIMTRLAEECGELAAQVNHFENVGVKRQKHGEPDRAKLAKEVQDVLRCALQIAAHYHLEAELDAAIEVRYQQALAMLERAQASTAERGFS
jgi:NTP pyrophosphatase (non-canonical NTP hydrolase)